MKHSGIRLIAAPGCLRGITLTATLSLMLIGAIPATADPITYNYTGSISCFGCGAAALCASVFICGSFRLARRKSAWPAEKRGVSSTD